MNYQDNKINNMNTFEWLQNWYKSQCNGDWEHQFGVQINTLDNPGWDIKIDIYNTEIEGLEIEFKSFEKSEYDWYGIKADKYVFEAFGDPAKLEFLILKFKEAVESFTNNQTINN